MAYQERGCHDSYRTMSSIHLTSRLRRIVDLWPWTPLGVLVVVVASTSLKYFAYGQLDMVLFILGYGALGLSLLSTILVLGATLGLKIWFWHAALDLTLP